MDHSPIQTDYILCHETNLNTLKRTEIIQMMSSNHNRIKLVFNNRKTMRKSLNTFKLSSTLLNNTWAKEEVTKKYFKHIKLKQNKNTSDAPNNAEKETNSITHIVRKKVCSQNTDLSSYLKKLEKRRGNKPKSGKRK